MTNKKPRVKLVKSFTALQTSRMSAKNIFVFVGVFAVLGAVLILATRAATPTANIEPETKSVTSPATVGADNNASGSSYVKFGSATPACPGTSSMNIVAHEDDDLLFMSPDLVHTLASPNACVTSVYLTMGDANLGISYALSRENGAKAAYAQMLGQPNSWNSSNFSITDSAGKNHNLTSFKLASNSRITLVFLRLPDGAVDGSGFSNNAFQSLMKLWNGTILTMTSANGDSYNDATLGDVLTKLMNKFQPSRINVQDYVGTFGDGDHSDHHAGAYYARQSSQSYTKPHTVFSYQDYSISSKPSNVAGSDLSAKLNAWFAYTPYDNQVCQNFNSCVADPNYGSWLTRQYIGAIQ